MNPLWGSLRWLLFGGCKVPVKISEEVTEVLESFCPSRLGSWVQGFYTEAREFCGIWKLRALLVEFQGSVFRMALPGQCCKTSRSPNTSSVRGL